jgi:hypothetical protein
MGGLLELVLEAHGGLEPWRQVQSLDVRVSPTGGLYQLKGYPEGVPNVTMRIDPPRPPLTVSPYAHPDQRSYFTPERVWIEDRIGQLVEERKNQGDSFKSHFLQKPGTGSTSLVTRCGTLRLSFFLRTQVSRSRKLSRVRVVFLARS